MWKSHAQTPEEEWAAPGQPGPSPEVSGSPPAEPKAPLGPGPAPPHTDISFVPAPRALTAEMRSERKVTRIRGNYTAPQKVTKKKKEEGGNLQVGSPGWSAVECEWAAPPGRPSVGPAHLKHLEPSDAESEVAAILRFPLPPHLEGPVDIKSKGGGREIQ